MIRRVRCDLKGPRVVIMTALFFVIYYLQLSCVFTPTEAFTPGHHPLPVRRRIPSSTRSFESPTPVEDDEKSAPDHQNMLRTAEERIQELREQLDAIDLDDVRERLDELREAIGAIDLDDMRERLDDMNQRLDGIFGAFEPATNFALMETAVYEFVKVGEPYTDFEGKIHHAASLVAGSVLALLLSPETPTQSEFVWGQPGKADFDGARRLAVGLEVLGALVAFIEAKDISKADVEDWPSEHNVVAHEGKLLNSLYVYEGLEGSATAKTGAQVKTIRDEITAKRTQFQPYANVEAGLVAVVAALTAKGLTPSEGSIEDALQVLKRVFP